jgi:hypothetical protein
MPEHRDNALTEFTKTKMHFALALIGTLFALHPFVERFGDRGFVYPVWRDEVQVDLKIYYVYGLVAALLALTVYFYALGLLSERGYSWMEKAGNYSYAIAVMILPLYGGLYVSALVAERVGQTHLAVTTPAVALGLGILWLAVSYFFAWRLRRRMGEQDRRVKLEQLADQEIHALNRAREMFASSHYDLAVIEAWKAIEARLRRALLIRKLGGQKETPQALVHRATRAKLFSPPALAQLQELRRQWNIAVSTEPLTRDAADKALSATRDILSTIPLEYPSGGHKPAV